MSPRGRGRERGRGRTPTTTAVPDGEKMQFLRSESKVEVSSDEEGFKGAWFRAKIVKSNTNKNKRKNLVFVEYEDLLASDSQPNEPLIEAVETSFIRPVPPAAAADPDQSYEVYDVVDAFHRDAWWKGVVSKVEVLEEEKRRYNVVFETPPEQFRFSSKDLRFHFNWSDGKWLGPLKQMRMNGLDIGKGMQVEVNLVRENMEDTWLPASVIDEVGFNSFLVEYDHNHSKETIDSFHIRIPPPKLEVPKFAILEAVDAYHDSCWKFATIQKILTEGRYVVLLKSIDKEIVLSKFDIRPHLPLTNDGWASLSNREIPDSALIEESPLVDNAPKHSEGKSSGKKLRKKSTTSLIKSSTSNKLDKTLPESEETRASLSKKSASSLSPEDSHPISMLMKSSNRLSPEDSMIMKSAEEVTGSSGANLPVPGSNSQSKEINIIETPDSALVDNTPKHSEGKSSVKKLRKKSATPLSKSSTSNKLNKTPPESEETLASYSKKSSSSLSLEDSQPISILMKSSNRLSPEDSIVMKSAEEVKEGSNSQSKGLNIIIIGPKQQEDGQKENGKALSSKRQSPQEDGQKENGKAVSSKEDGQKENGKAVSSNRQSFQEAEQEKGKTMPLKRQITRCPQEAGEESRKAKSLKRQSPQEAGEENGMGILDTVMSEQVPAAAGEDKQNTDSAETTNQIEHINNGSNSLTRLANSSHLPHEELDIQKESKDKGEEEHNVSEGTASKMDMEVCAGDVSEVVVEEKQELPFTKTTSFWEHIDSLKAFKWLPQKPHFSPLLEQIEAVREGFAIGNMLNFDRLVDNVLKLTIDKPTSVFESHLKALSDLETHGFNVKPVVDRINKCLSIKIREEEVEKQSNDLDGKIVECDSERVVLREEMNAIEERIRELEEQHAMKMVQKMTKDSESASLKKKVNRLKEEILGTNRDFQNEAAAPW